MAMLNLSRVFIVCSVLPMLASAHLTEHRSVTVAAKKSQEVMRAKDAEIKHFECQRRLKDCSTPR